MPFEGFSSHRLFFYGLKGLFWPGRATPHANLRPVFSSFLRSATTPPYGRRCGLASFRCNGVGAVRKGKKKTLNPKRAPGARPRVEPVPPASGGELVSITSSPSPLQLRVERSKWVLTVKEVPLTPSPGSESSRLGGLKLSWHRIAFKGLLVAQDCL